MLFPMNFVQMGQPRYRRDAEALLETCRDRDVGTMIIKSITRGPWGTHDETHATWYRPFESIGDIRRAVNFVLSHEVTGLCTAGDTGLLPLVLEACEAFVPMSPGDRDALIAEGARGYEPLFV
jgi:hypothetical protein